MQILLNEKEKKTNDEYIYVNINISIYSETELNKFNIHS